MNTKYKIPVFLLAILISLGSCESLELDVNESPNTSTPDKVNLELLLNGVFVSFAKWLGDEDEDNQTGGNEAAMEMVRMLQAGGPLYQNAYQPSDFDDTWKCYSGHLKDIQTIKTLGEQQQAYHHVGVAQIIESYTLTTLVDYFGDVPYSEALLGKENPNPGLDDDQAVYNVALQLLDDAISNLEQDDEVDLPLATSDMYFAGTNNSPNRRRWITLAKSLKLRIWNNTRLVDPVASRNAINALITEGDLIDSPNEDWTVKYGTNTSAPDVRSTQFFDNYVNGPSGEYMSLYFMNLLKNRLNDPRLRYYFYRQSADYPATDAQGIFDLPCLVESFPTHWVSGLDPFCTSVGEGYWGRPHLLSRGLPSDGGKISTWGAYPIGGRFDDNSFRSVNATTRAGLKGAGIHPIVLSSFIHFARAEAALVLGTIDNAREQLESGMTASIAKVQGILGATEFTQEPDAAAVTAYINTILSNYDAADNNGKLDIIITQAYIASFGNGVEPYNGYRRTGMPLNLQPALTNNPGAFIRSFKYPSLSINNNPNISAKPDQTVHVFWDLSTTNLDF
jgi:hypothetical protein